jgi:hypothetical protein
MKSIRRLPDSELEVMQALWACEIPAGRADIAAKLQEHTDRSEPLAHDAADSPEQTGTKGVHQNRKAG